MSDNALNDARIKCFGSGVPVFDVECVDAVQSIWRGTRILEPGTPQDAYLTVYFSRAYNYDKSDLDRMLYEYHFDDPSLLGVPFLVVPKEKVIFGFDPPSETILKPPVKLQAPGPFSRT
jgi:hypothetical protein